MTKQQCEADLSLASGSKVPGKPKISFFQLKHQLNGVNCGNLLKSVENLRKIVEK